MIVLLPSVPRPNRRALFRVLRSMASERARRKRTSRLSCRQTGSEALRLGYSASSLPRAFGHRWVL
jgi:hypothetical protein